MGQKNHKIPRRFEPYTSRSSGRRSTDRANAVELHIWQQNLLIFKNIGALHMR